jgi:hypothetical protein
MNTLTREQSYKLRRLTDRIRKLRQCRLTVKVTYVPSYNNVVPGELAITASTKENYERLLRMVHRIVPDVKPAYEHGVGWHYMDKTPYHYGAFSFLIKND